MKETLAITTAAIVPAEEAVKAVAIAATSALNASNVSCLDFHLIPLRHGDILAMNREGTKALKTIIMLTDDGVSLMSGSI